jgi:hypothetical protein
VPVVIVVVGPAIVREEKSRVRDHDDDSFAFRLMDTVERMKLDVQVCQNQKPTTQGLLPHLVLPNIMQLTPERPPRNESDKWS